MRACVCACLICCNHVHAFMAIIDVCKDVLMVKRIDIRWNGRIVGGCIARSRGSDYVPMYMAYIFMDIWFTNSFQKQRRTTGKYWLRLNQSINLPINKSMFMSFSNTGGRSCRSIWISEGDYSWVVDCYVRLRSQHPRDYHRGPHGHLRSHRRSILHLVSSYMA